MQFNKTPYAIRLLLTDKCNLSCPFCLRDANTSASPPGEELNTEQWLDLFEELKKLRVFSITLSGGEIFLRDDLFILIKRLRENRMHQISLITNGTLITGDIAEQLHNLKIKSISVSLDGMQAAHDQFRGTGSFEKTMAGIQNLLKFGIKPTISFTATRKNHKEIGELADIAASLGLQTIQVNTLSPEGRCLNIYSDLVLIFPGQVKEILDIIDEKKKKYQEMKIICQFEFYYHLSQLHKDRSCAPQKGSIQYFKSGCGAASTSCVITPTGDVVPCEGFLDFKGGNIKEKKLFDIWNESENFKKIRDIASIRLDQSPYCSGCQYNYLCDGGCRASAYLLYDDLLAPGNLCPFKKGEKICKPKTKRNEG